MAMPKISHAAIKDLAPVAIASDPKPIANTMFDAHNTGLPPCRSIVRPSTGPKIAETPSPTESAA